MAHQGDDLPNVTVLDLQRAAPCIKEFMAIRVDGIPQKALAALSDALLDVVAQVINRVEDI